MTWYQELPKVELHIHLEGAIPHSALFELIQKYGGDPSVPDIDALEERFKYKSFSQFIEAWSWKNQFLKEYEDFTFIAKKTARDLAGQNIKYAELFFSPSLFIKYGLNCQELTLSVRKGLSKVEEIEITLIADLVRDYGEESELITLSKLNEVRDLGVIGIGIGGSEHEFPPELFKRLFQKARKMGFHTNAHAGEAAGAQSIWSALQDLRVERIGHGTNAINDHKLLDYLAENRVPLEMCPMSNVRTGAVDSISNHPIRECFERGIVVSVNTDDPKMFDTSLEKEYRLLEQECGFTKKEICKLILLGIESSWLPPEKKKLLSDDFISSGTWMN